MVIYDNREHLKFYDQVLGLLRVKDKTSGYESDINEPSAKAIFSLRSNQRYTATDFDHPESSKDPMKALSGRLKIIRFSPDSRLEDKMDHSKPGSLGYSLYTYRVLNLERFHERVKSGGAKNVTPIILNELNERSFSFVAPDGYFWNMIERK